VRIIDHFPNQIAHLAIDGRVFHVAVAGDALSCRCLETDHYVRGTSRQDCLEAMARRLRQHLADQTPCQNHPARSTC
jgi:hypothetical protein